MKSISEFVCRATRYDLTLDKPVPLIFYSSTRPGSRRPRLVFIEFVMGVVGMPLRKQCGNSFMYKYIK